MKKELKKALQDAFEVPAPKRKQAFFRSIEYPKISYGKFILTQALYIRKRVWALSAALFFMVLICGQLFDKNMLWGASGMMPFLALSVIAENTRSEMYGMAELEMTTRFSLKSIVLARMGILSAAHMGVLILTVLFGYRGGEVTVLQTGVYLLVPYLLTDASGLWLVRKVRGREAVYACTGLAVIISTLPILGRYACEMLYEGQLFGWWLTALFILCVIVAREIKKNIAGTEEMTWSFI